MSAPPPAPPDAPPLSLQRRYSPNNRCYGCGPTNERGLRLESWPEGDELVAEWTPEPHHESFAGVLNGGVIATLFDCHCNWAATYGFMLRRGVDRPPGTVTAELLVRMHRPTPSGGPVRLRARVEESTDDRATVRGTLEAGGQVTATCRAVFVAVKEDHPAYRRW